MNFTNNSNNISNVEQFDGWTLMPVLMAYIIEGLLVGGTNIFIVIIVLYFKALREAKEYLVIMCLSLADGCNMMAYVIAGVRRMVLVYTGNHNLLKTPWDCMTVSHNIIWSFSELLSGLVLLIISLDRLLVVAFPIHYINWSNMYVLALFGVTYFYTIITGTVMNFAFIYMSHDRDKLIKTALCFTGYSYSSLGDNPCYFKYREYGCIGFAFISVVVYGMIWILYNKQTNRVTDTRRQSGSEIKKRLARQRRLTQNLGISCVCTICVFMIPYGIGKLFIGKVSRSLGLWVFIISNLNPLCNIIIYYYRQPEMKQAFVAFFTRKTMPDYLEVWKANTGASVHHRNSRKCKQPTVNTTGNNQKIRNE